MTSFASISLDPRSTIQVTWTFRLCLLILRAGGRVDLGCGVIAKALRAGLSCAKKTRNQVTERMHQVKKCGMEERSTV